MRGHGCRRVVVLVGVLLVVGACSDGGEDVTPIEPDTATEPSEDAADDDVEAVPDPPDDEVEEEPSELGVDRIPDDASDIDEAYVQDVLEALDPLYGDAFAAFAVADEVDEEVLLTATLVFSDEQATRRSSLYVDETPDVVDGSGPPTTRLLSVLSASTDCIGATVERDVTGVFEDPGEPRMWDVVLVPSTTTDRSGVAWVYDDDFVIADGGESGIDGCGEREGA